MAAMSNPQHQLAQLKSLPALPATVTRLVSALNNDELDMRELVDIVKRDEALTVAVLRLANSSVYGGAQDESFDLNQSITRIGFKKLREIALAHKTSKLLERPVEGYGLDRGQLWEGAIAGAVSAEIVAQKTQLIEPEMAFVAGLLRDIGKLAMDTIYTSEILRIQFEKRNERQSQLSLEQEIFGMDHAELGYELAKLWELPERLCVAIRYHHGVPDEETEATPSGRSCMRETCSRSGWDAGSVMTAWPTNSTRRPAKRFNSRSACSRSSWRKHSGTRRDT
jgi:HD-like signal output (HDOD) protein